MTASPTDLPGRVVDRDNYGWFCTVDAEQQHVYVEMQAGQALTYAALVEAHGPVRPVVALNDEDARHLSKLFLQIGRKAVTTLAAALELVHHRLRGRRGGLESWGESSKYARTTLIAGRPGSWESALLHQVVLFGNGLNLADEPAGDVEQKRLNGPSRRVDKTARDAIAAIIERWVTDPAGYTEVAENLAGLVSHFADDHYGPDGWKKIADQWLDPAATLRNNETEFLYQLFYSRSAHYEPILRKDPSL